MTERKGKELRKWQRAQEKAHEKEINALTFTKYQLNKHGWRYIDFRSKRGYGRTGIIDLVAVKLDEKDPDKLKIMLFEIKGGSARIKEKHKKRLRNAVQKVEVHHNWAEKPEKSVEFGQPID